MITSAAVLRPREDLVLEVFDDAILIWDERRSKLHHLDAIAARIWSRIDGERSAGEISDALAIEFPDVPRDRLTGDVINLLQRVQDEGLCA